ncbi:2-dehydropantoate 2-reductase N-terminal domain-containing protein [Chryseobacterium sp.]|uniref:ketopantoate reductase family protein n=1 Tax=Chryseobacterium sp. TaxID=1871047 RepID=UPI0028A1C2A5|nr:2-dehydropantoate 2-reductase N-terminal domain-containing protein [Chryseobacterium sp.]
MNKQSICIIGAGSMGVTTGYFLQKAGAEITFLVLPNNKDKLLQPQKLYCYDDQKLKTFTDYKIITNPSMISDQSHDFIIITLDSASLQSEEGLNLVDELGRKLKDTDTNIIIGSVGIEVRQWFIERSGIDGSRVINGTLPTSVYEVQKVNLPLYDVVNTELLSQADYGYRHPFEYGFTIDTSSEAVAKEFASIFDRNGTSICQVLSEADFKLQFSIFPQMMTWGLLNWNNPDNINANSEIWNLGTEATKEFQRLSIFGEKGLEASRRTDAKGTLEMFQNLAKLSLPLDFSAFNAYHHGGKVINQDLKLLDKALEIGKNDGLEMPALTELIYKLKSEKQF